MQEGIEAHRLPQHLRCCGRPEGIALLPTQAYQADSFFLASGQVRKMVFYLNLCKFLSEPLVITDFIWCVIQRNLVFLPTVQTPHKLYFSN